MRQFYVGRRQFKSQGVTGHAIQAISDGVTSYWCQSTLEREVPKVSVKDFGWKIYDTSRYNLNKDKIIKGSHSGDVSENGK